MTSDPTYPQTHPDLPKGKEQVTPNIGFCLYIKVVVTQHIDIEPPPNLPRRGGTDTIVSIIVYMCVWDVRQCPRGTDTLVAYYQKVIDNQSNLQLPVFDKAE